jgi:hypothetical protein
VGAEIHRRLVDVKVPAGQTLSLIVWANRDPVRVPRNTTTEVPMHARVVRFTDVSPERIAQIVASVDESDGPPPGVDSTGFQLFVDEAQGTAIFVGFFETEQKMRDASAVFEQMDSSETPGTRASVDLCEVKAEATMD